MALGGSSSTQGPQSWSRVLQGCSTPFAPPWVPSLGPSDTSLSKNNGGGGKRIKQPDQMVPSCTSGNLFGCCFQAKAQSGIRDLGARDAATDVILLSTPCTVGLSSPKHSCSRRSCLRNIYQSGTTGCLVSDCSPPSTRKGRDQYHFLTAGEETQACGN